MSRANTGSGGRQIYCRDYKVQHKIGNTMFVFYIIKTRGGLQQGEGGLEVRGLGAGQALPLDIHCRCHRRVNTFRNINKVIAFVYLKLED